jgi:hypothetical protein
MTTITIQLRSDVPADKAARVQEALQKAIDYFLIPADCYQSMYDGDFEPLESIQASLEGVPCVDLAVRTQW